MMDWRTMGIVVASAAIGAAAFAFWSYKKPELDPRCAQIAADLDYRLAGQPLFWSTADDGCSFRIQLPTKDGVFDEYTSPWDHSTHLLPRKPLVSFEKGVLCRDQSDGSVHCSVDLKFCQEVGDAKGGHCEPREACAGAETWVNGQLVGCNELKSNKPMPKKAAKKYPAFHFGIEPAP